MVSATARSRCVVTVAGRSRTTRSQTQARYSACTSRGGKSIGPGRSSPAFSRTTAPSPATQVARSGPGVIGPSHSTDSSVKIVTSDVIEFIHNNRDCSRRQIRPPPAGYGSTT